MRSSRSSRRCAAARTATHLTRLRRRLAAATLLLGLGSLLVLTVLLAPTALAADEHGTAVAENGAGAPGGVEPGQLPGVTQSTPREAGGAQDLAEAVSAGAEAVASIDPPRAADPTALDEPGGDLEAAWRPPVAPAIDGHTANPEGDKRNERKGSVAPEPLVFTRTKEDQREAWLDGVDDGGDGDLDPALGTLGTPFSLTAGHTLPAPEQFGGPASLAGLAGGGGPGAPAPPAAEPVACETPMWVTKGVTLADCTIRSDDPNGAALTIDTTEPVVLEGVTVLHAGEGITSAVADVDLTVIDSVLVALDPGDKPANQRAIQLYEPARVTVEHSDLIDGHGIWLGGQEGQTDVDEIKINDNVALNIGRHGQDTPAGASGPEAVQFVQFDKIRSDAEIAGNLVQNFLGMSQVEDNINLYESSGLDGAHPILIHDNLIYGAYGPASRDGSDYVGGGIMLGDHGGDHQVARDNTVLSTSNYGVAITGGDGNELIGNTVVNDGRYLTTPYGPDEYAQGVAVWDPKDDGAATGSSVVEGNKVAFSRPKSGRADLWIQAGASVTGTGNTALAGNPTNDLEWQVMWDWVQARWAANDAPGPRQRP